uniref:Protein TsetseEP domain-containing protein n=1 Tax=Glossina austeni TaxID=7395 RepID=A0A1A9VUU2_GLOAU
MPLGIIIILIAALAKLTLGVDVVTQIANTTAGGTNVHLEDYIESYRRQFTANLDDYNNRIDALHKLFERNLETVEIQKHLLLDRIRQTDEGLFPLELLNVQNKKCVSKHRNEIPSSAGTQDDISKCLETAKYQLRDIGTEPRQLLKALNNYYSNNFEKSISSCLAEANTPFTCVEGEILKANEFTINHNLKFNEEMDNSEHYARAHIKAALNCSFVIHFQAAMSIAETKLNIDLCMKSEDNYCMCKEGYTCNNLQRVPLSDLNSENIAIANPLYGTSNTCLMLTASSEGEDNLEDDAIRPQAAPID